MRLSLRSAALRGAAHPGRSQSFDATSQWQRVTARFDVSEDWPTELAYVSIDKPSGATVDIDAVSLAVGQRGDFSQTDAQSVGVATIMPPATSSPAHKPLCSRPLS